VQVRNLQRIQGLPATVHYLALKKGVCTGLVGTVLFCQAVESPDVMYMFPDREFHPLRAMKSNKKLKQSATPFFSL
jgi:hypothetical protein